MNAQMVLFPLNDQEWRDRSKRLAALVAEYARVEENKKETMKAFSDTLKDLRTQMQKVSDTVLQGREWREGTALDAETTRAILEQEERLGEDGALDAEDISVTCRHCRVEFSSFSAYITHRREAHPVA